MIAPEEENDSEVRREDQDRINRFARLNARINEIRSEREDVKRKLEGLDDASTELMMGTGDMVMILEGEAFFGVTEDNAVQYCEQKVETLQEESDALEKEEATIAAEQADLKAQLYGRFGKSINLEAD